MKSIGQSSIKLFLIHCYNRLIETHFKLIKSHNFALHLNLNNNFLNSRTIFKLVNTEIKMNIYPKTKKLITGTKHKLESNL
jgi:hypothetical protein